MTFIFWHFHAIVWEINEIGGTQSFLGRFLTNWKIIFCRKIWTGRPNWMKLRIYQGQVIPERYRKGQYRSLIFRVLKKVKTWENVYSKWTISNASLFLEYSHSLQIGWLLVEMNDHRFHTDRSLPLKLIWQETEPIWCLAGLLTVTLKVITMNHYMTVLENLHFCYLWSISNGCLLVKMSNCFIHTDSNLWCSYGVILLSLMSSITIYYHYH